MFSNLLAQLKDGKTNRYVVMSFINEYIDYETRNLQTIASERECLIAKHKIVEAKLMLAHLRQIESFT
jgi:hypothetical protein